MYPIVWSWWFVSYTCQTPPELLALHPPETCHSKYKSNTQSASITCMPLHVRQQCPAGSMLPPLWLGNNITPPPPEYYTPTTWIFEPLLLQKKSSLSLSCTVTSASGRGGCIKHVYVLIRFINITLRSDVKYNSIIIIAISTWGQVSELLTQQWSTRVIIMTDHRSMAGLL